MRRLEDGGREKSRPIAEKIFPLIVELYESEREFLVTLGGKPVKYQNFLETIRRKNEVLKSLSVKHLPHDGKYTCATLMDDAEISLKTRQMILGLPDENLGE